MDMTNTKRKLFLLWLTFAFVILLTLLLFNQSRALPCESYDDLSPREQSIVEKMERKYLSRHKDNVLRFIGDAEIDEDEFVTGDILIIKGTLELDGEVDGNVLAVFGDIELGETALVRGDAISVNGKVWSDDEAYVRGDIVITSVPIFDDEEDKGITIEKRREESSRPRYVKKWPDDNDEVVFADYNRVDGITLGLQFPQPGWWANNNHHFALIGKGGYSFASKRWHYQIGMERWTGANLRFTFGGELHNMTDTQDRWIICDHENALAAFFIKEDFRDYYNRSGYSFHVSQNFSRETELKLAYHNDDFTNLNNETDWALFGKKKHFRVNPIALPHGFVAQHGFDAALTIKSIAATFTIDNRNSNHNPTEGWYLQAFAEHAGEELNNEFQFQRFIVDVRRYQPLSWDEKITVRLRAGSSTGLLPPVYWFDLGGISSLRGLRFKELTGDRMVLGNVEYHLNAGDANFLGVDLILFVDSGVAWFANEKNKNMIDESYWPVNEADQEEANELRPEDTFENLTWASLKTNAGVALASPDGDFRVNFAKRIDKGGSDIVITLRISQPF